jgi:hypothetical protein
MQANSAERQTYESLEPTMGLAPNLVEIDPLEPSVESGVAQPTHFSGHYSSCMEMYADAATVIAYLDMHPEWFYRCAHPMMADSIGNDSYALIIGRFGSFGYEVEPKIGLHLLPQDHGVYRIETIPVPGYKPQGYEVDFRAFLQLVEGEDEEQVITRVEWELDLDVAVYFPRFIRAIPQQIIHATGDRLLNQIVRQVSRRLTRKVQLDFHDTHNLPFPGRKR